MVVLGLAHFTLCHTSSLQKPASPQAHITHSRRFHRFIVHRLYGSHLLIHLFSHFVARVKVIVLDVTSELFKSRHERRKFSA